MPQLSARSTSTPPRKGARRSGYTYNTSYKTSVKQSPAARSKTHIPRRERSRAISSPHNTARHCTTFVLTQPQVSIHLARFVLAPQLHIRIQIQYSSRQSIMRRMSENAAPESRALYCIYLRRARTGLLIYLTLSLSPGQLPHASPHARCLLQRTQANAQCFLFFCLADPNISYLAFSPWGVRGGNQVRSGGGGLVVCFFFFCRSAPLLSTPSRHGSVRCVCVYCVGFGWRERRIDFSPSWCKLCCLGKETIVSNYADETVSSILLEYAFI